MCQARKIVQRGYTDRSCVGLYCTLIDSFMSLSLNINCSYHLVSSSIWS